MASTPAPATEVAGVRSGTGAAWVAVVLSLLGLAVLAVAAFVSPRLEVAAAGLALTAAGALVALLGGERLTVS